MTLDQRAWCAPITLKVNRYEKDERAMKIIKASPIDKGTTVSLYKKKSSGELLSRTIDTAQNKKFVLKVNHSKYFFALILFLVFSLYVLINV